LRVAVEANELLDSYLHLFARAWFTDLVESIKQDEAAASFETLFDHESIKPGNVELRQYISKMLLKLESRHLFTCQRIFSQP
jgi:hypothetical protein